jgi:transposase
MRFVELKSPDQLDMQTLHLARDRLVGERTVLINQLRAILLERGFVAPQGSRPDRYRTTHEGAAADQRATGRAERADSGRLRHRIEGQRDKVATVRERQALRG